VDERVNLVPAAQFQPAGQPKSREIGVTLEHPAGSCGIFGSNLRDKL